YALALLDGAARGQDGGARALALRLLGGLDARWQDVGDAAAVPNHADDSVGARVLRGLDDPVEHRDAADGVQDLRERRVHARPVARGHDERGELRGHCSWSLGTGLSCGALHWGVV